MKTLKEVTKVLTSNAIDELDSTMQELIYYSKRDAWISACEWLIKCLKENNIQDCEEAFQRYINADKQ